MINISRVLNYIRYASSSKLVLVGVFMLALGGIVGGYASLNQTAVSAATQDCDTNAVIRCGFTSAADFTAKYQQNSTGDLPAIYSQFGLPPSQINNFNTHAVMGVTNKTGTVQIAGRTVATNAQSLGRSAKPGAHAVSIGGKTYFQGSTSATFLSSSLPTLVLMNGDRFVTGVIMSCANPITATPNSPAPSFACNMLTAKENSRTNFTFTTQATAAGGAKIAHYVYDFGDGTSQQTTSATVSHTYAKVGTFNTKVTVFVTVNGSTVAAAAAANCAKQVVVKPVPVTPVFACNALSARLIGKAEDRNFAFTLTFTAEGGAVLNNADLNFGDGTTLKSINPSELSSGNINHSFAREGTFTTTATLHFNVNNDVQNVNCTTVINASPNVCATNPSLPANSPECAPCTIPGKEQFPKNSPECVEAPPAVTPAPTALPSTGPTDMINGAMGVGSVSGAGFYWLRSRRDMINKILGR